MKRASAGLAVLLLTAGVPAQPAPSPEKIRNHFDSDAHLSSPAFFEFVVLGAPGRAQWKVVAGRKPFSSPNQLMQIVEGRPADSIAAGIRRNAAFRDGTWSVAIQNGAGRGGLVFRMIDEKNFRVLLVDLSTGDALLTAYEDGKPLELARARAAVGNPWGILSITARGANLAATWDRKALLEATDPNPASGRAGLATAGPGLVAFDDFILDPAEDRKP